MKFYTHIPAAILLYSVLVWIFNEPFTIAGILFTAWISVMPDLLDKITGEHRGIGHSIIWLIPIIFGLILNLQAGIALLSGYTTHILFDTMTRKGVPFLYPFKKTAFVMPKKEKQRIITGSTQEKALCLVIIMLLCPLAYGVTQGFPDFGLLGDKVNKTGNNSTNKTRSLYGTLSDYANKDWRTNNSYPNYYKYKYNSSSKKSSGSSSNSNSDNTEQSFQDWLNNNPPEDMTIDNSSNNNQNNTNQNNTNQKNLDPLFDDMSAAGDPADTEYTINMTEDDSSQWIPSDFTGTNPDADNWNDETENNGGDDSSGILLALLPILISLGGLVGKL